jgi:serine protease Do
VTNNHVVAEADEIEVQLQDGRSYQAKLIGRDPKTDLALLKVETEEPLPFVKWGSSDELRVGDPVIAVGNPFGLGGTVTAGIVSARSRDLGGPYDDYLQIDAPINRGNSGGPTFNLDGEVVGVNSAIFSPTGGSVGIGFAISSDLARDVVAELREDGTIERGYLGVTIQQVNEDLAAGLGMDEPQGALVTRIMPDSPAAEAGFERGDAILSYNGTPINDLRDLTRAVADTDPGERAEVVVWRDGEEVTLGVSVGTMPTEEQVAALPEAEEGGEAAQDMPQLGLGLARLDPQTRAEYGIADDVQGVVIARVEPNSAAARQGIRPGDVIVEAGQQAVDAPDDVAEAARKAADEGKESLLVLLHRDDSDRFVAVPLDDQQRPTAG